MTNTAIRKSRRLEIKNFKRQSTVPGDLKVEQVKDLCLKNECDDGNSTELKNYESFMFSPVEITETLKPKNDVVPDPTDPNNYCRSCNIAHDTFIEYKSHLFDIHGICLPVETPYQKIAENNYDTIDKKLERHCSMCQKTFNNNNGYKQHLRRKHKITIVNQSKRRSSKTPSITESIDESMSVDESLGGSTMSVDESLEGFQSINRSLDGFKNFDEPMSISGSLDESLNITKSTNQPFSIKKKTGKVKR